MGKPFNAAEFWMIEPEIAFADLNDDMILAESMLKYIINYVIDKVPLLEKLMNGVGDKGTHAEYRLKGVCSGP